MTTLVKRTEEYTENGLSVVTELFDDGSMRVTTREGVTDVKPTVETVAEAQAALARRQVDAVVEKLRSGGSLTDTERDKLLRFVVDGSV